MVRGEKFRTSNGIVDGNMFNIIKHADCLFAGRKITVLEFRQYSGTGHDAIGFRRSIEPSASPVSSSNHVGLGANLMIETGDSRLDVVDCHQLPMDEQ